MKGDFRDEAHRFEDIDKAVLAKIKRQAMTKDTPERWVYQFHKEPLGGGEHTEVFTFGPEDECESGRVEVRDDYADPCEARADAETLVRRIVAAYNATYAAGINPDAVKGLISFAVAMAEDSPDECVRNAVRKIVKIAKPDWRPRPGAKP